MLRFGLGERVSDVGETGKGRKVFPKSARKYVPVGLGRAIPGAPRFWKHLPALALIILCAGPNAKKQVDRSSWRRNPTGFFVTGMLLDYEFVQSNLRMRSINWADGSGAYGEWWGSPPKNVGGQGWPTPSAHGRSKRFRSEASRAAERQQSTIAGWTRLRVLVAVFGRGAPPLAKLQTQDE
ncbi:MAG: hypothetical protein CMG85_19195 [Marinobacter sp.]|nr:hypothetical protein [Marinobacter sp.]